MSGTQRIRTFLERPGGVWLFLTGESGVLGLAWTLRRLPGTLDPLLYGQLQIATGLIAVVIAAAALVRFRGTRDRLPLVLACGFVIVGITLVSSSFVSFHDSDSSASLRDPMTWVIGRTLLAVLLVVALFVERRLPTARNPGREISMALVIVVLSASLLSTAHGRLPADLVVHAGGAFPRPGNLFPAVLFLIATIGYYRRLTYVVSPFDRSLYITAGLNVACCLAATQSEHRLDAPFAFAEILQFGGYAVLLGGALLDNIHLFDNVQRLAVSDPLTGLANYRRLVDALESEIQRSRRTGRPFSLLLFDLDGLKKLNDSYGHLVGSKALCRVANVLRVNSRSIDTAARYGGDEFALILPETGMNAAEEVARRVCERVARAEELPPISVSVGVAVYARGRETLETLVGSADQALYHAKARIDQKLAEEEAYADQ
jgi:diguanylate cyclase (GGDEF)-like protein